MSTPRPSLILLGASVRAAAQSACRAGYAPYGVDLFADEDLRRLAATQVCTDYPNGLVPLLEAAPQAPWLYTGALENHPGLIERLAGARPLWGNHGDVLRQVRSPAALFTALTQAGFATPRWTLRANDLPADGAWLCKKLLSGGGNGVAQWDSGARHQPATGCFWQEYVPGPSFAAIYVASAGQARLLGATWQLIGCEWAGCDQAGAFRYCGSLGPMVLPPTLQDELTRLGAALAERFSLAGLFGVDAILAPADRRNWKFDARQVAPDFTCDSASTVWPLEVNPRYTASVEILERGLNFSAIACHATACQTGRLPQRPAETIAGAHAPVYGKAIVYARDECVVPPVFTSRLLADNADQAAGKPPESNWPRWADIPAAGTKIERGWPIATAFACADTPVETLAELRRAARLIESLLAPRAGL